MYLSYILLYSQKKIPAYQYMRWCNKPGLHIMLSEITECGTQLFQLHPYDNYQLMPYHRGVNSFLSQLQLLLTYFWVLESADRVSKPLTLKDHSQRPALGEEFHAPLQLCNIWVILGTSQNPAVTLGRWNQSEDFYYGDYSLWISLGLIFDSVLDQLPSRII